MQYDNQGIYSIWSTEATAKNACINYAPLMMYWAFSMISRLFTCKDDQTKTAYWWKAHDENLFPNKISEKYNSYLKKQHDSK